MTASILLHYTQRLQAMTEADLAYTQNAYAVERYEEIRAISVQLATTGTICRR